jgi:RNA polymerase sigma-70 factor (ECF subfamily)
MSLDKEQEFARLVDDHRRALQRYVLRRLADVDSSEDVLVEVFAVAWRRRNEIPPRDRELPWLFSIAFRVISNHRRTRDRQNKLHLRLSLEREVTSDDDAMPKADSELLFKAMHELAEIDQELLQLVYWEKLKYGDVAVILGLSENAVAIRAMRAKKSLRKLLSGPLDTQPTVHIDGEEVGA